MNRTLIIAEVGVNHNGSIDNAKKLIDIAADAGVDYIKFQTFKAENLVTKSAPRASYQDKNTGNNDSQFEMLKKLELSIEDHQYLIDYCNKRKIQFLSSGFDLESLQFLKDLGITLAKIPSGEITNYPYLKKVAELFSSVILSTGMATMQEIEDAVNVLLENGIKKDNLTILHCNTEYPTPMKDVNLNAMAHIKNHFNVKVGYSDHTLGIEVPIAAVALGATVIEKHFTLDKEMEGPDHKASLNPQELKSMVAAIRNIEKALGSNTKQPSKSEKRNIPAARKSIVASTYIKKGEIFTEQNITTKRPGTGISPMKWHEILGQKAITDFEQDQLIVLK